MAQAADTQGIFRQNLMDAGCDRQTMEKAMALFQTGQTAELLLLLSRHRSALLDAVHHRQKQIDCLDYLIFQTKKQQRLEE